MNTRILTTALLASLLLVPAGLPQQGQPYMIQMTRQALEDRILGGWVGKAYGVAFGGPTEFKSQGKIIEGPLKMDPKGLARLAGQDDMYVNMALLKAVAEHGLDAPASAFAKEFTYGGFLLWHANGQGRQNLLAGIPPEKAGHPLYNPHADDIDFQIEADFIGLTSPGLPQAAAKICDRAGHLMNYGDGFYGGVFVSAMYAAAFVEKDIHQVVQSGAQALPNDSGYARIIKDVLKWHQQYPADWKTTWQELENKYNHDTCPWGAKDKFNIQARFNGAYIALGLLYGNGDFLKTIEISTRAGQDSDCNPANAGGVLGTLVGFKGLPEGVRAEMEPHLQTKFDFTPYSIQSATSQCLRLALDNIKSQGGQVSDDGIQILLQSFRAKGPAEVSFPTLKPVARFEVRDPYLRWNGQWSAPPANRPESLRYSNNTGDSLEVQFEGTAVYVQGDIRHDCGILETVLDGKSKDKRDMYLPKQWSRADQSTAVWLTGLADGPHKLQVRVTGEKNVQSSGTSIGLGRVVAYRGDVAK